MLNKEDFFSRYPNLDIVEFDNSQMNWEELMLIYDDYINRIDDFQDHAEFLFRRIIKFKKVHSCKFRIKDAEHLIEKIIRKNISGNDHINIENYRDKLHDIIGLRAIHLYKEDWELIDNQIKERWSENLVGAPVANLREGDSPEFIQLFEDSGGVIKKHQYGYRSIHYIVCVTHDGQKYYAEIQVRTIFEEGWSEIDHDIRYPYQQENPLYKNYLAILNRLAGASDEMATMLKFLDQDQNEKIKKIEDLNSLIDEQAQTISIQRSETEDRKEAIKRILDQMAKLNLTKESQDSLRRSLLNIRSSNVDLEEIVLVENSTIWIKIGLFFKRLKKILFGK